LPHQVSRRTRIPSNLLLYRGIGGLRLPPHFYKSKEYHKGFVEWGFMSTTSNKAVAMQYTGVDRGQEHPTILRIRPASVDHGADISEFSQYPGEREYLWNPCSLLEPWGDVELETTESGMVPIIPVHANMNIKTMTVEELRGRRKEMHLTAFRYQHEEMREALLEMARDKGAASRKDPSLPIGYTVEGFLNVIVAQALGVYLQHKDVSDEDYMDDEVYRGLVFQMLETKAMALSKLNLWLEDLEESIATLQDLHLREAHRWWTIFLERRLARLKGVAGEDRGREVRECALSLCKIRGLVDHTVDERNDLGEVRIVRAAAAGWNGRALTLLVDAGADIDSQDRNGRTTVQWAAIGGNLEAVHTLVRCVRAL
jgi:hypothetical protein